MLFSALGLTTAIWLLFAPLLGIEEGARAVLGVGVGVAAIVLLPLGMRVPKANAVTVGLGALLGFANFFMRAEVGAYASYATCAMLLVAAGTAPWPVTAGVFTAAVPAPARQDSSAESGDDTRGASIAA